MKKIVIIAIALTGLMWACKGSIMKMAAPQQSIKADTNHVMLKPNADTKFLNEAGKEITIGEFQKAVASGKYSFKPGVVDGKLASVRLTGVSQKVTTGKMAPDFDINDIAGNRFNLKDLKGKIVIVNFWFTSCAPCQQEMPGLNDLVKKYKEDKNIVFIGVTFDSPEKVKAFLAGKKFEFHIAAGQQKMINDYGISGYPTSLVIDKTGSIAFMLATNDGTNVEQLDGVIGALKSM